MNRRITVVLLFLGLSVHILAQQPTWHFWGDFNPTFKVNKNISVFGDVGIQVFNMDNPAMRSNIRPGLSYKFNRTVKTTAGLGYFIINGKDIPNLHELRPFLGLQVSWPQLEHFNPTHYFRFEARNLWLSGEYSNYYESRFRYELKEQIDWGWFGTGDSKWYTPIAVEVFLSFPAHSEEFTDFERLRISAGVGREIDTHSRLELYYIYQGNQAQGNEFLMHTTDHMLRLRYYVNF